MSIVYVEGAFLPIERAGVSVFDRGLLYGDGLFATVRVVDGKALYIEDYLKKLQQQCDELHILMPPLSTEIVEELIARNPGEGVMRLRIVVTGGEGPLFDLSPRKGRLLMGVQPYAVIPPQNLRMALFSQPLALVHARYKTLANFNRFWVLEEAKRRGFDDGISISAEGYLLEASFGNLFWIVEDRLYLPDRSLPYYFGITLTKYLEQTTCSIHEVKCRLEDIPAEAQLFRANTMNGIVPILSIEERTFALELALLIAGGGSPH